MSGRLEREDLLSENHPKRIPSMIGAVSTMLQKPPAKGYEDQVTYHILLGLGVPAKLASELSTLPMPELPPLPMNGILGKVFALTEATKAKRKKIS